ncbi:MAG: hypothetical protein GY854_28330 [Deltaproteobacteria bacterium]|nr:hypothetical protein [Deltaproteobacteria bacterium]
MIRLYVWTEGGSRAILQRKPLVKQLIDGHDIAVAWGCRKEHKYLIEDIPVKQIIIDSPEGEPLNGSSYCPRECTPLSLDTESEEGTYPQDWRQLVDSFNHRAESAGLDLSVKGNLAPTVQFKYRDVVIRDDAIFLEIIDEKSPVATAIDLRLIFETFRGLNFYCATPIGFSAHNLIDCSDLDLVTLASISNNCSAIIGTGGSAFTCSLTETNRFKPRALLAEAPPVGTPWGDYKNNPLRIVSRRDELVRFLVEVEKSYIIPIRHGRHSGWQPTADTA